MSHPVLAKYRDLQVVSNQAVVNRLWQIMVSATPLQIEKWRGHSKYAGRFVLLRHADVAPGKVLEYVPDMENDTSVTTLYNDHSIFASRQTLIEAREEIIGAIDHHLLSIPNTAAVKDGGRDNKLFILPELGTAQLLDVLAHFTGSSVKAS